MIAATGYDQFGNRSLLTLSTLNPYTGITPQATTPGGWQLGQNLTSTSFDAVTNRVVGASYLGGNQTSNLSVVGDTATYDAENRLSTVTVMGDGDSDTV